MVLKKVRLSVEETTEVGEPEEVVEMSLNLSLL